jgi:hypothetical protein
MIARQPDLGKILKLAVRRDFVRRQMAMVIVDGLFRRVAEIKLTRPFGGQKKIVWQERFFGGHEGSRIAGKNIRGQSENAVAALNTQHRTPNLQGT